MTAVSIPPPMVYQGSAAIVLSGGGARGAYEAGVLRYLFGEFSRRHGVPRIDIISGTSVGAINGAFLASVSHDPVKGIARLSELWAKLELDQVMGFGFLQAAKLPRVFFGGRQPLGLFEVSPLIRMVNESIAWADLANNLHQGLLQAVTISATHVATGRPWCFVDLSPGLHLPTRLPPLMTVRGARIGPQHVLASAAIPVLFPPVTVSGEVFVDGGLRLNTPMSPALQLGAQRLLVVGLTSPPHSPPVASLEAGVFPGINFLLGKILNAFLLDHVNADFYELERMNRFLDDGCAVYGPDFIRKMNARAQAEDRPTRHRVHAMAVHPSTDIGLLAGRHLKTHEARFGRVLGRSLLRLLDLGRSSDSDLFSYLLFDGDFAQQLMDLGEQDARRSEEDLAHFFWGRDKLGKTVDESR